MKTRILPPVLLIVTDVAMWFVARSSFAMPIYIPFALIIAVLFAVAGI